MQLHAKLHSKPQHRWQGTAAHTTVRQPLRHPYVHLAPRQQQTCRAAGGFEPHVDPTMAATQLAVLATTVGTAAYWWLVLVPSERVSLAKNKRKGELKQYLDELEGDEGRVLERWFYTDWLRSRQQRREQAEALREWRQRTAAGSSSCAAPPAQQAAAAAAGTPLASEADAATTRTAVAVATIERPAEEAALSAAPSEPAAEEAVPASEDPSKMPSFWSLDNPIVVTFAVLGMVAALSALLSKVTQLAGL